MTSEVAPVAEVCQYTPLHRRNGGPATTTTVQSPPSGWNYITGPTTGTV
jgi:hypothetical protein